MDSERAFEIPFRGPDDIEYRTYCHFVEMKLKQGLKIASILRMYSHIKVAENWLEG